MCSSCSPSQSARALPKQLEIESRKIEGPQIHCVGFSFHYSWNLCRHKHDGANFLHDCDSQELEKFLCCNWNCDLSTSLFV
jgi:hypothetical protein